MEPGLFFLSPRAPSAAAWLPGGTACGTGARAPRQGQRAGKCWELSQLLLLGIESVGSRVLLLQLLLSFNFLRQELLRGLGVPAVCVWVFLRQWLALHLAAPTHPGIRSTTAQFTAGSVHGLGGFEVFRVRFLHEALISQLLVALEPESAAKEECETMLL